MYCYPAPLGGGLIFAISHIPQVDTATLEKFLELVNINGNFGSLSDQQLLQKNGLVGQTRAQRVWRVAVDAGRIIGRLRANSNHLQTQYHRGGKSAIMVINLIVHFLKTLLKLSRYLFWLGLWAFGLAMLLWLPLRWWPGDRLRPVQLLNYFMPWLLVGLAPALVVAMVARRVKLMIVLAISTLAIALNFAPLFLPRLDVALAGNTPLKVMSYNLLYRNQNLTEAITIIRQEQPDILLLQEVTPEIAQTFQALNDLYPNDPAHYVYDPSSGQATLSRHPIKQIEMTYEKGRTLKIHVDAPGGPIAIWNVHPNTPRDWPRHYRQLAALADDIAGVKGPLIVGGDFNTTYHAEAYNLINRHLTNAQWEAGWGFGFTFPANAPRFRTVPILSPVIRIDHIFYNDYFFARRAATLASAGGSDHLPIVAEFLFVP